MKTILISAILCFFAFGMNSQSWAMGHHSHGNKGDQGNQGDQDNTGNQGSDLFSFDNFVNSDSDNSDNLGNLNNSDPDPSWDHKWDHKWKDNSTSNWSGDPGDPDPGATVPEPMTWALLMIGLAGIFWLTRKTSYNK